MRSSQRPEFIRRFENGFRKTAELHTGPVVLAPSNQDMADEIGCAKGMLYHYDSYNALLEEVSGLQIVHNGLVLGERPGKPDEHIDSTLQEFTPSPLDEAKRIAAGMTIEEKMELISYLAINACNTEQ